MILAFIYSQNFENNFKGKHGHLTSHAHEKNIESQCAMCLRQFVSIYLLNLRNPIYFHLFQGCKDIIF